MIISCPHCQTKYQVTYEAIGSAGRKVQCAHCQQAWDQGPLDKEEPPPAVSEAEAAISEDTLDEAMSAAETAAPAKPVKDGKAEKAEREKAAKAAKAEKTKADKARKSSEKAESARDRNAAGKIDRSVVRKRRKAFSRPQENDGDEQTLNRLRLALRVAGAAALVGVLSFAYMGRVQIVERFPSMAGVYAAVGMNINVVGLDFTDVTSLQTLRDGKEVLIVSAQIVGMSPKPVPVPAVVVTLIGPNGNGVYQWSVQPSVRDLMAGERSTFDTQLTLPPGEASRVRLSFSGGSGVMTGKAQRAVAKPVAPAAAAHGDAHIPSATADDHAAPDQIAAEAAVPSGHDAAEAPAHTSPEHH